MNSPVLQPHNENLEPVDTSTKQKRAPTTPQTPSVKQLNITRRKFDVESNLLSRQLSFTNPDLMNIKYNLWLSQKENERNKELISFLELERNFELTHQSQQRQQPRQQQTQTN